MRRLLLALPVLAFLAGGCNSKQFLECDPKHIIEDWGVTNSTDIFGMVDSIYYLINPAANYQDSLYYNANYTDSYYHSDSTRVTLRYTLQDSINFCFDRLYAVESNPDRLIVVVAAEGRPDLAESVLHMKKVYNSDLLYRCGPDSLFKELLKSGMTLRGAATNGASTSEPQGSQNYEFAIDTKGFDKAFALADSLSRRFIVKPGDSKSREEKDSTKHDKKFKLF